MFLFLGEMSETANYPIKTLLTELYELPPWLLYKAMAKCIIYKGYKRAEGMQGWGEG